mmetsp:Transcript_56934/g.68157  ORF Transcript_56934/g.68157 Transcript_56934/m.68157 type:complete len:93 (+) Transcript_56934:450-728(+)
MGGGCERDELQGVDFRDADDAGQQLIFCNTYHLLLQPGADVIGDIGRKGGTFITDSGGFHVRRRLSRSFWGGGPKAIPKGPTERNEPLARDC